MSSQSAGWNSSLNSLGLDRGAVGVSSSETQDFRKRRSVAHIRRSAELAKRARFRTKEPLPESFLSRIITHPRFESFGGCVVLFNFVIMTVETHATAISDDDLMDFVIIVNRILLAYYTLECALRLYVMKSSFFYAGWNNLDFLIVVTGMISEFLEISQVSVSGIEQITMLKSLRMLRLTRLVRLLVAFRELYSLIAGIGRCMKTLLWASGLIFISLNVWAILSVEFLDEKVRELANTNTFTTCTWCPDAFSNIWYANLTWFQIISTADWSTIGRPLAEHFYWPYAFFVINVFVVTWGLLNLIVAGLVDANIAAREDDVDAAAHMAAQERQQAWSSFAELCVAMDEDGSGDISIDEFKAFWKGNTELQQHLTIMGVQEKDLDELLALMDEDGSGLLESAEFIEQFTMMRTLQVKSSIFFLYKYVKHMLAILQSIRKEVADTRRMTNALTLPTAKVENQLPPTLTGDKRSTAVRGALRGPAHEAKAGKPHVDIQTLPPGWYYFGATLPLEASAWCKAIDPDGEAWRSSKFQPGDCKLATKRVTEKIAFTTDSQTWEAAPPSLHASQAKQSTASSQVATADIGDIELHPKSSQSYDLNVPLVDVRANMHDACANRMPSTDFPKRSGHSRDESKFQPDDPSDVAKLIAREAAANADGQKYEQVTPSKHARQDKKGSVSQMPSEGNWDESKDPLSQIPMDFPSAAMFQPTADAQQQIHW